MYGFYSNCNCSVLKHTGQHTESANLFLLYRIIQAIIRFSYTNWQLSHQIQPNPRILYVRKLTNSGILLHTARHYTNRYSLGPRILAKFYNFPQDSYQIHVRSLSVTSSSECYIDLTEEYRSKPRSGKWYLVTKGYFRCVCGFSNYFTRGGTYSNKPRGLPRLNYYVTHRSIFFLTSSSKMN